MRHVLPRIFARWAGRTEEVGSWSTERELTGSALPGNLRGAGALSIGTASFEVAQTPRRTPWNPDLGTRLEPKSQDVDLVAVYDDETPGSFIRSGTDLGAWRTSPISGSLIDPALGVDLVERSYIGREQPQRVWMDTLRQGAFGFDTDQRTPYPVDPIWVVSQLAAQMGYFEVPPPVPSAIFAVPFQGGAQDVGGDHFAAVFLNWNQDNQGPITEYNRSTGALGAAGTPFLALYYHPNAYNEKPLFQDGRSVYYTLNVVGDAQINTLAGRISIDRTTGLLWVDDPQGQVPPESEYLQIGWDDNNPHRIQVECQALVSYDTLGTMFWRGFRARSRTTPDSWTNWAQINYPTPRPIPWPTYITVGFDYPGSSISGLQVTTEADPGLWAKPNARFSMLGGSMDTVWFSEDTDVWTAIQDVCKSYAGSAWIALDRALVVRNRSEMAGVGQVPRRVNVDRDFEDIGWTIDPSDTADRVEVTYRPIDYADQTGTPPVSPIAWEASDVIEIGPRQTVEVVAELENPIAFDYAAEWWYPAWSSQAVLSEYSVWSALPNRDGTGAQPPDTALRVEVQPVSSGRAIIRVTNTTNNRLFTVDRNGQPALIMKTARRADQNVPVVVSRGLPGDVAQQPFQIDLGRHVQRLEDAEALADYLWARLSAGLWRAESVRVALDWSYDLGDVLLLDYGDLQTKALVTKVTLTGSAGEVQQKLDLAVLPPTWDDFDAVWEGFTWNDFDDTWAGRTWNDFDRDPVARS